MDRGEIAEIVKKLQKHSDLLIKMREMGLLEPEEVEVLSELRIV